MTENTMTGAEALSTLERAVRAAKDHWIVVSLCPDELEKDATESLIYFAELQAKCDAMEADARRYRIWRASAVIPGVFGMSENDIDQSIDASAQPMTHEQEAHEANERS